MDPVRTGGARGVVIVLEPRAGLAAEAGASRAGDRHRKQAQQRQATGQPVQADVEQHRVSFLQVAELVADPIAVAPPT